MNPTFAQRDPCSGAPSQHGLHAPPPVSWPHLPALRPMLASPGLCYGCLLPGFRCSCGLALALFLTHSRRGGDISEVTGGQSFLRNSVQAWCCPAPQHSMELPLPEAAKNTPDRNPASLQQTRKAWTIKAQSRALVEGVSWTPAGASGSMWNSPGGKLSSGHPLLHAQQHLTRDFPHRPLPMDYRRSLLCLSFLI